MLGTGLQLGRGSRGRDDRLYGPAKARRNHRAASDQLRRAQSDVSPSHRHEPPPSSSKPASNRTCLAEPAPAPALSNLERFLRSITPSVPVQYFPKTTMKARRPTDAESCGPYFVLGDLWESFKEWSAYGAGVPLILDDTDSVVQYYVPYLSGIQIYCDSSKLPAKPRRPDEDSDSDFRDSSSDGSSDCEPERRLKHIREQHTQHSLSNDASRRMDRLSLRDQPVLLQEDFSSDEGENVNSQSCLMFEYLEQVSPYGREPLADKILDLAFRVPELKTLRSCDLLSTSWFAVAWYPIYRIPTGPTLKDLDACFLTYHYLSMPMGGVQSPHVPVLTRPSESDGVAKMPLPVFGLASYKFKGPLWTPTGGLERQLANSLSQDADNWLRQRKVSHPDFMFFSRR